MTTTPDYTAIDWVLENVEGARPERPFDWDGASPDTTKVLIRYDHEWQWETNDAYARRLSSLDELDALAILRDWWREKLEQTENEVRSHLTPWGYEVRLHDILVNDEASPAVARAIHPDRTTTIARLVRRVWEAGKGTP